MRAIMHDAAMDADAALPGEEPLPDRLKRATRSLHAEAEQAGAMGALLRGALGRAGYVDLLGQLLAIYAALEAAVAGQADAAPAHRLWRPAFARTPALRRDIEALARPGARATSLRAATAVYVERLQQLTARDARLVAHLYVRCLGDLHGGQLLAPLIRRRFGLAPDAGTSFYDFGAPADVQALRSGLRSGLASLSLDEAAAALVIEEARWSFGQHRRIFEELAACPSG
jgi:heme oxygenase